MELYHVLNRGTDKRNIVMDDRDRQRFVRNLYEMNNALPVFNMSRKIPDIGRRVKSLKDRREPLVQIHGWCLMNNHYHLLLSEIAENGISKFLKKLNMGYSKYFNLKHKRVGTLFQGKTKKLLIDRDAYFLYILHYIHFNPLDYLKGAETWREKKVQSSERALTWLSEYRWSSFRDYNGENNFPEIIAGSFMYRDRAEYAQEAKEYLHALTKEHKNRLNIALE